MDATLVSFAPYLSDVNRRIRAVEQMPLPASLGELLDQAAAEVPDKTVWNFFEEDETETYEGLRRRSNGLASALTGLGIAPGTHVAVMLPNIPAFPLTWLALARMGAVMVPVNIGYKPRELEYILVNSEAEFLVIHSDFLPVLDAMPSGRLIAEGRLIVVGEAVDGALPWSGLAAQRADNFQPARPVAPGDLMNIQYTSGTTGFPKGCMLSHEYWIVSAFSNAFRDGLHYDHLLTSTPFYYMDPQWILLMTLLQRGTVYVARRQSTSRYLGWLTRFDINFCLFPWILHKQPHGDADGRNQVVRANVYGVPRNLHRELSQRFSIRAREAFGMTELGPTMFMPIEAEDMVGSGSCGVPAPFRDCRLVDEDGTEISGPGTGELLVRGRGILGGYYGNPEATAEAFDGAWFRTGDLFRRDGNGFYSIIGRRKDSIRRSGENIAAREVESVINSIEEVSESAVIAVPDDMRGEEVKALIVLREGIEPHPGLLQSIIDRCRGELADFKVPRYYAFRQSFPRTGSSKIAKHLLARENGTEAGAVYDRVPGEWIR